MVSGQSSRASALEWRLHIVQRQPYSMFDSQWLPLHLFRLVGSAKTFVRKLRNDIIIIVLFSIQFNLNNMVTQNALLFFT